jgi:hypothetical protein
MSASFVAPRRWLRRGGSGRIGNEPHYREFGVPPLTPGSIIEKLFQVDPKVARVILIGLAVLAAIAIVGNWGLEAGNILPVVIWLAVCYLLFAFLANMPGWLGRLLGTVASLAFVAYVGLFAVQLVSVNRYNPPIMVAGCFFSPNQQGCPLQVLPASQRAPVEMASAEPGETEPDAAGQPGTIARPSPDPAVPSRVTPPDGRDLSAYRVFVQYFPQRIDTAQARDLASGLAAEGWPVATDVEGQAPPSA